MTQAPWPKLALGLGVVLGVAAAIAGSTVSHGMQVAAVTREAAASDQLDTARYQRVSAGLDLLASTSEHTALTAVVAERAGLVDAAKAAESALASAADKVDVAAQRQTITDAENRALAERADPAVVRSSVDAIHAASKAVTDAVEAYDNAVRLANTRTSTSTYESSGAAPEAATRPRRSPPEGTTGSRTPAPSSTRSVAAASSCAPTAGTAMESSRSPVRTSRRTSTCHPASPISPEVARCGS